MDHFAWLAALGVAVGTLGTLIGAGGGFILIPVLLLIYPDVSTGTVTSISLAVVFFNALSGSWAYARMKRIDYRSGLIFAAATIPGAVAGALATDYVPRRIFDGLFGALMVAAAIYLFRNRIGASHRTASGGGHLVTRRLVEASGAEHIYSFNLRIGLWISLFVGCISSLLGIGGGIVHVPALVRLLNFPVHIATATSHFMLAIMALAGTAAHVAAGTFGPGDVQRTLAIAAGVLVGAQFGAALSTRLHGLWIIRGLALALAIAGLRILLLALHA